MTTQVYNVGGFTRADDGITVPSAGLYQVSYTAYMTSTAQRPSVQSKFSINGVEQAEIASMGYIRATASHNESSTTLTTIYELEANDKVNLLFAKAAGNGTVLLQGANSSMSLVKVA